MAAEITNISINGTALFFMIPNLFQPQKVHAMSALWLLPVTFIVYYFAFKFAITKFNLKTPGRDDEGEIKLMSKKEYNEIKNSGKDGAVASDLPEDALETVSYTHLDVYKRQVSSTPCVTMCRRSIS